MGLDFTSKCFKSLPTHSSDNDYDEKYEEEEGT
jgi:hypothetical protein